MKNKGSTVAKIDDRCLMIGLSQIVSESRNGECEEHPSSDEPQDARRHSGWVYAGLQGSGPD
jgi:hypothetical protein